jgi:hypothetical protein
MPQGKSQLIVTKINGTKPAINVMKLAMLINQWGRRLAVYGRKLLM